MLERVKFIPRKIGLPLVILAVNSLWFQACRSSDIPWANPRQFQQSGFIIFPEPGLQPGNFQAELKRAAAIKNRLIEIYFPGKPIKPLQIALFKNLESYRTTTKLPVKTLAHYRRTYRKIYIAVDSPEFVWRHELTHALLEERRPGAPFWFQEGLALFAHYNPFPELPGCKRLTRAKMGHLLSFLSELRKRKDLDPDLPGGRLKSFPLDSALAGYFIYYLWDRRKLLNLVWRYQRGEGKSPEEILTGGRSEAWWEFRRGFRAWLISDRPTKSLPGC